VLHVKAKQQLLHLLLAGVLVLGVVVSRRAGADPGGPRLEALLATSKPESDVWALTRIVGTRTVGLGSVRADSLDWSRDGERLVLLRGGALFVAGADGRDRSLVAQVGAEGSLSWSADGRYVAVTHAPGCRLAASVTPTEFVEVRTGRVTRVLPLVAPAGREGRWLANAVGVEWARRGHGFVLELFGGVDVDRCAGRLDSVPQSTVFVGTEPGAPLRILARRLGDGSAVWSPDGTAVADCARESEGGDFAVTIRPVGSGRGRTLVKGYGDGDCALAWPRSDTIVTTRFNGVFAHDPRTGSTRRLAGAHWGYPRVAAVSSRGGYVASADDRLRLIPTSGGPAARTTPLPPGGVAIWIR
jgi:hypothetical protein